MGIERVGIVGAGTMGTGIATSAAAAGLAVRLVDARPGAAAESVRKAAAFYDRNVEKGRMSADDAAAATARIEPVGQLGDLAAVDLVIEAVFEEFELKARLFGTLSGLLPAGTLVATNTSCLRVSDLARHMAGAGRFLGLHFFSPAEVNPIVEVVKGEATADATIAAALDFCRTIGKQPLRCRDSWGFAINRFFCPYTNEAARALDDGLGSTAEIDAVAKEVLGAAAGPFQVMNLIKPRINLHAIRNLAPLGAFYAPAASMVATGDADRAWEIGAAGPVDTPHADAIADRLRAGAFLPVLQALDEDVAEPAAFDQGALQALKLRRPPCALMDELGRDEVTRIIQPALDRFGIAQPRALERVGRLMG